MADTPLAQLLELWTEDALSDDQFAQLAALLEQDASARAEFIHIQHQEANLFWDYSDTHSTVVNPQPVGHAVRDEDRSRACPTPSGDSQLREGVVSRAENSLEDKPDSSHGSSTAPSILTSFSPHRPRGLSRASRHLAVGVTIAVAFVATSLSVMHQILLPVRVATEGKGSDERDAKDAGPVESIARLVNDVDAQWEGHVENPVFDRKQRIKTGMKLYPGQKLKLVSGLAEFKFFNGAEVVLEGPAEFEVLGKKVCRLEFGRLVGRCPVERSKKFVVETPTGKVRDLGTEFGVEVRRSGRLRVEVFDGEVDVAYGSRDGSGTRARKTLAKGETLALTANGSIDTQAASRRVRFVRSPAGYYALRTGLVTPVAAFASSQVNTNRGPENTIDNPEFSLASTHSWGQDNVAWQSNNEIDGASIAYDLGGLFDLTNAHVWNYDQGSPFDNRGIRNMDVFVSSTDTADVNSAVFTLAVDNQLLSDPNVNPVPVQSFALNASGVRWVRFTVDGGAGVGNHGGTRVGLFEVKFGTALEPVDSLESESNVARGRSDGKEESNLSPSANEFEQDRRNE